MSGRIRGADGTQAALLFALALAIRLPGLLQEGAGDELYHVLAAQQHAVDGSFAIQGGEPYQRGWQFTWLVVAAFRLFGESLFVARLPAVLFGALCAALVFLWLRGAGERAAAWFAALLVGVDPELVKASQLCRFYTLQHFLFLAASVAVWALVAPGRRLAARIALAAGAALALGLAGDLQIITWIGAAGLGLFVALAAGPALLRELAARRGGGWLAALAALGIALGLGIALRAGLHEPFAELAGYADLWARGGEKSWRFYHGELLDAWPTLWPLFPFALLLAARRQPRLALLCACGFAVPFLAHSALAWKASRYLAYALPLFFVGSALALGALLDPARRLVADLVARRPALAQRPRAAALARAALLAGGALFLVLGNRAFVVTARGLAADPSFRHPGMTQGSLSWKRAAAALAPELARAEALVATDDTKAIYYLGRVDYVLNLDHLWEDRRPEAGPRGEFEPDVKIATPLVSSAQSLRTIIACHASGIVVAQESALANWFHVPAETAALLRESLEPIPLPAEWGIVALRWSTPRPAPGAECPAPARRLAAKERP